MHPQMSEQARKGVCLILSLQSSKTALSSSSRSPLPLPTALLHSRCAASTNGPPAHHGGSRTGRGRPQLCHPKPGGGGLFHALGRPEGREVNGQWGSKRQGQCPHLPGRPMPIFSRSSFLTYSKWDRRVTLRSSRSRRKYCCSCTSDSSSSSQPAPSSGCMLLLPSLCGGRGRDGSGTWGVGWGGDPLPEGPGLTHLLLSCFNEGPKSPACSPKLYRTPCSPVPSSHWPQGQSCDSQNTAQALASGS